MLSDRIRRWIPTVALVAGALTLPVMPTTVAGADPCPDVELIFARGTNEPVGVGRVGDALANALQGQLSGRSVTVYGVNYPASYDFVTTADGATDATNRISALARQCPSTQVVVGGYSQGAAVVDMLAGVPPLGNKIGDIGSAPPLPYSLAGNIAAVAVFGNPATKFGNPVSAAGSFAGKSIDLCSDGDPICSDGRNPFAHRSYESSAFIPQAADFIAGRV